MRVGEGDPLIAPETSVPDTLKAISRVGIGATGVIENGKLIGIVTDGDLRRKLTREMFDRTARDLMTANPVTISPDGRQYVYVASGPDGKQLLWLHPLDAASPRALAIETMRDQCGRSAHQRVV